MKIEKLPSGSYRIRKMYKGNTYTVTTNYKPTQKEAMQLLAAEMDKIPSADKHMTFQTAAERYIEMKSNVLSPATIRGYTSILKNLPDSFREMLLSDIDSIAVQSMINGYTKGHSPKSVRNIHGFVTAILAAFCPNTVIRTTLPQKCRNKAYLPTDEDVRRILEYAKGSKFEIALILATFGLRRSEICALTPDDVHGNLLTINKALVQGSDMQWTIKTTKTEAGTREIYLPDYVVALIKERGYIYKGYPGNIFCYLKKAQQELGIQEFGLHRLRHYYASTSHAIGIPDQYIMEAGGWKSKYVLGEIYQHAMADKKMEMQKAAAEYYSRKILS